MFKHSGMEIKIHFVRDMELSQSKMNFPLVPISANTILFAFLYSKYKQFIRYVNTISNCLIGRYAMNSSSKLFFPGYVQFTEKTILVMLIHFE